MSARAEVGNMSGEEVVMGKVPTFDQVWPQYVPSDWWGPEWVRVVEEALAYYRESPPEERDRGDYAAEYADGFAGVYSDDIADRFHALRLWAVASVADYYAGAGVPAFEDEDGNDDFIRGASLYLYAAGRLAMEAVLRAAAAITDDTEGEK